MSPGEHDSLLLLTPRGNRCQILICIDLKPKKAFKPLLPQSRNRPTIGTRGDKAFNWTRRIMWVKRWFRTWETQRKFKARRSFKLAFPTKVIHGVIVAQLERSDLIDGFGGVGEEVNGYRFEQPEIDTKFAFLEDLTKPHQAEDICNLIDHNKSSICLYREADNSFLSWCGNCVCFRPIRQLKKN